MVFGPWQPLEDAASIAPPAPGVLQARGDALVTLPRGKSAMVLYAAGPDGQSLRDFVRGSGAPLLAGAARQGARYLRFAPTAQPSAELTRLLERFRDRFGALPPANRNQT